MLRIKGTFHWVSDGRAETEFQKMQKPIIGKDL